MHIQTGLDLWNIWTIQWLCSQFCAFGASSKAASFFYIFLIMDIVTKYDGAVSAGDRENCSLGTLISLVWSFCYPFPTDPDPRKWETVPAW